VIYIGFKPALLGAGEANNRFVAERPSLSATFSFTPSSDDILLPLCPVTVA